MDSGLLGEPVIGPRFARTRWLGPGMTRSQRCAGPFGGGGCPFVGFRSRENRGEQSVDRRAEAAAPVARLAAGPISGSPEITTGYAGRRASRRSAAALGKPFGFASAPVRACVSR